MALGDVIERLGRVLAGLSASPEPPATPALPDWLAERLTSKVGLAPDTVARMSLQEAVDTWTDWTSRQR